MGASHARSRREPRTAGHVLILVEILDRLHESLHDVIRQGSRVGVLAHPEGQTWDRAVEHIVRVGLGGVDVARGRRVVVVQPHDAEARGGLLGLRGAAASAQVLDGQRAGQSEERSMLGWIACEWLG